MSQQSQQQSQQYQQKPAQTYSLDQDIDFLKNQHAQNSTSDISVQQQNQRQQLSQNQNLQQTKNQPSSLTSLPGINSNQGRQSSNQLGSSLNFSNESLQSQSNLNSREKQEFLRKSRTLAPARGGSQTESLLSKRNECQQCKREFTQKDFQARDYRTCTRCQERSICKTHIDLVTRKCDQCYTVYEPTLNYLLPPQTREEAQQELLLKQATQDQKRQSLNNQELAYSSVSQQSLSGLNTQAHRQPVGSSTPAFESNQFSNESERVTSRQLDPYQQEPGKYIHDRKPEHLQERFPNEEKSEEIDAEVQHKKEFDGGVLAYNRTLYWILTVFFLLTLFFTQYLIFANNQLPKDKLGLQYSKRFDQYREDLREYFSHHHHHSKAITQDYHDNLDRVRRLIHIFEKNNILTVRRDIHKDYQLYTMREQAKGYAEELQTMFGRYQDKTSEKERAEVNLVIKELNKFVQYTELESQIIQWKK